MTAWHDVLMSGGKERRRRWQSMAAPQAKPGQLPISMWAASGVTVAVALVIAGTVTYLGLRFLHFREFKPEPELSAGTLYDLLKVAFAFAAGIGGVVALVTAYRRQRIAELAHELAATIEGRARRADDREAARLFNERFAMAAGQLGSESPAVRLAGVYAMAGLADDWEGQRQTCVDVLCAYLRMPHEPASEYAPGSYRQQDYQAAQQVRRTVIRVITAHLQAGPARMTSTRSITTPGGRQHGYTADVHSRLAESLGPDGAAGALVSAALKRSIPYIPTYGVYECFVWDVRVFPGGEIDQPNDL